MRPLPMAAWPPTEPIIAKPRKQFEFFIAGYLGCRPRVTGAHCNGDHTQLVALAQHLHGLYRVLGPTAPASRTSAAPCAAYAPRGTWEPTAIALAGTG